jgi:ATP-dependent DNA helicase RecG
VMNSPEWEHVDQQQLSTNRIVPIYPLTAQVTQRWLRHQLHQLVSYWAPRIPDPVSEELRQSATLVDISTAVMQIHFPDTWEDLKSAQERLAFDEIFLLQLGVLGQKKAWQERTARIFHVEQDWLERRLPRLPFDLTNAQLRTLKDVCHDLETGRPMNRLIQGDVGSGKTVIAALAAEIIARHGAQSAIMAPTSILAEQHYRTMLKTFASPPETLQANDQAESDDGIPSIREQEIRLLVGATPEPEKREIRAGLASGDIKLVVGTHALIEDPVAFANLQLVVVDEQHRFGVEQRAALRSKGDNPHLMVMTATPIPRSLQLTIFGDLDVSVIDEMPAGRIPASTYVLTPRERERAYTLIRSQIQQGHQAFIIYPLVEESENNIAKAAVEEYTRLKDEVFSGYTVGLLHGRMRPEEKDAVMVEFCKGGYQILVSTSVVEVGIDIPNATIILIEGANRFGLAQLHQFRGRVGRGSEPAYCLLIPDLPDEIENERLQVMARTTDGFVLAEYDLKQRGPGQFLGTRQSGYAELKLANLTDIRLIEKARRLAHMLFERDPGLINPENQLLALALQRAWGNGRSDIS